MTDIHRRELVSLLVHHLLYPWPCVPPRCKNPL